MFIEKTPWKVRKIQNNECIFQVPMPRVVKILIIYCINACHMYKTYGRPNVIILLLRIIMLQA